MQKYKIKQKATKERTIKLRRNRKSDE
ncbi:conserved hypothetical protein [Prevotella intermedia]|uniref:Uncharacterized protein n=1 Tax=Prevotella intermedia TaxID=28131 RepID=A0A0T7APX0_PREIN|nr:conserved hypothetical protein [Prevotella intermedia]